MLASCRFSRSKLFALLLSLSPIVAAQSQPPAAPNFPGPDWQLVRPESEGYSSARFDALRSWLASGATSSMVVVVHGHLIFSYGDIAHPSKIASVRKSILSMLYSNYVLNYLIDLGKTVVQLDFQEPDHPFLPIEKNATLEQLISGHSGIYLLPIKVEGNHDAISIGQPTRGSQYPGMYFHYNDWDFNAAGTAFEKLTGQNIYDALQVAMGRRMAIQLYWMWRNGCEYSQSSKRGSYAGQLGIVHGGK